MKRPGTLPRTPLRPSALARGSSALRSSPMPSGNRARKPLPTVNVVRKAKRAATYKAFLSSAVWKRLRREALERAGHRCEHVERFAPPGYAMWGHASLVELRCHETERLTVHHLHYSLRFGGNELPSDLIVLCKAHHNAIHANEGKKVG